ncbi:MAG: hypothetical protein K6U12_01945 [Armatimonadetes bacterium]|nr:hypothetical protein [Armatimonadota bacterium]GBC90717.1 hypothetical protein HRbin14_01467 [bacterium HR14]
METRDFLTDEELMGVLTALRRPRPYEAPALQAAPPDATFPQTWKPEGQDLKITLELFDGRVKMVLSGGEEWKGALLHCRWEWYDATQPEREVREESTAIVIMPSEPNAWGRYSTEVVLHQRVAGCPAVARIVPRYADPEVFLQAWRAAHTKPSIDDLERWIKAHTDEFAPRHRERWRQLADELRTEQQNQP